MKQHMIEIFLKTWKYCLEFWKLHKIVGTIIIAVVGFGGYSLYNKVFSPASVTKYSVVQAHKGKIDVTVSGSGQVISNSQVDLKPKVNANVTAVYVKAGDRVKRGQVLFRLDATDAYKQVRDAKTALESAQIALLKLKNPKAIDVMTINDSIKQEEDAKKNEDMKVDTAYRNLLNTGIEAIPEVSYTTETAPTISGSYLKNDEGQIRITVSQGGATGYMFTTSGLISTQGDINTITAQPIGDTGLYIKWNSTSPTTNWIIDIPNKQSSSYSSNYNTWQNAITNRNINNAASDRNIANLKQKLADLTPGDDNLDVRSAQLSVEQKQNALLDAQTALSNYTIVAPFDGVMANVQVDIGSSAVMASANSASPLGTIVTDKKLAQVILNESDIVKVKLGQKAKVTFDAIDGLEVEGDIVEINTLGTVTSGVVTYKVKIAFSVDDPRILPNMNVSADIITDSKDGVLIVPAQAVKHDANGYYVEVEDKSLFQNASSSSMRFTDATSSMRNGYATSSRRLASSTYRSTNVISTSSGQRRYGGSALSTLETDVVPTRVLVTIGIQSDTQTEITSGLEIGEYVVTKKTTSTVSTTNSAPAITSLLRPQRAAGTTSTVRTGTTGGGSGNVRIGQ